MSKKTNPRRIPATMEDVNKAKKQAAEDALRAAYAIFFTVMWDKEGLEIDGMKRIWDEVNALSQSVTNKYVSIADLQRTLRDEYGIELEG